MGVCFFKVFDGCFLKINCVIFWIYFDIKGKIFEFLYIILVKFLLWERIFRLVN